VVNVECCVSDEGERWPGKEFSFRGDPDALPAMREAGVEVANLGNNHSYDYGPEALVDTRQNVIAAGLAAVGAGRNAQEANEPALFDRKGRRIAVIGLDQVVDPDPEAVATSTKPGTADGHDFDAMLEAVKKAKARADLLVVMIHWGVELDTQPRSYQVADGHDLIDAGADVILGSHSHRLQPMEMYKGRPILYSLGNFVWPNFSVAGSTTGVAEVKVDSKGGFHARLIPAFITAPGHPELRGA
jgi:poly-gamma-glutamate capsule biosynthesis protein CapA/YwtB (metallophosphatase superfamily)